MKKLIIGIAFIFGSIIPMIVFVTSLVVGFGTDTTFKAPGKIEIHAEKPGQYHIWNYTQAIFEGTSYTASASLPEGAKVSLTAENPNAGAPLVLQGTSGMTVNIKNQKKTSIGYFTILEPGKYLLDISGLKEPRVVSYSFMNFSGLVTKIVIVSILTLVFLLTGIVLVILGIVQLVRRR